MSSSLYPPCSSALLDLTAFESAARPASFLKAAEGLHVTPSAVSHRIKSLEEFLGVPLFIRINRNIALISFGERYLVDVRDALTQLGKATANLKGMSRACLRIAAAPALGHLVASGTLSGLPARTSRYLSVGRLILRPGLDAPR